MAGRLAKCHPEQHFHRLSEHCCAMPCRAVVKHIWIAASLNGRVRPRLLAWYGIPVHLGIEPPFHRGKQRLPVSGLSMIRAAGKANSGNMQAIDRIVI